MKIILPGGSGHVGAVLAREFRAKGHDVVVLSRQKNGQQFLYWDGRTLGDWARVIDGADVVINLAGRSVDCRYTAANLKAMLDSRVDSTRVIGQAIAQAANPPPVWLQMSTTTIYAHRFDAPNDESGPLGGSEPNVPAYWRNSIDIALAWEDAQQEALTPKTRKVALRTAMVMCSDHGSVFDVLLRLTRMRLGGPIAGGRQFVSWIHEHDFVRALEFLIRRDDFSGAVNIAAPHPLPQAEFMRVLRQAWGTRVGLPTTKWIAELGAFVLRTDTELLLKSRRVIPGRLTSAGFTFEFPDWPSASHDLVKRWRLASSLPRKQVDRTSAKPA